MVCSKTPAACQADTERVVGTLDVVQPIFERLLVFGVGLIGGSLALAAKQRGLVKHVTGVARTQASARQALELGLVDAVAEDLSIAIEGADAIFLAVPVAQFPNLFDLIARVNPQKAVIFDGGSTKAGVLQAAFSAFQSSQTSLKQFVPCHPIAGAEKHGPQAATADLFEGKSVIICQHQALDIVALQKVSTFWQALSSRVGLMSCDEHDRIFAAVSHLPHWLAFVYVDGLLRSSTAAVDTQHGGGGFRDFSRIAASSPEMWADIFFENKCELLKQLKSFESSLHKFKKHLEAGNQVALQESLGQASVFRQQWRGR